MLSLFSPYPLRAPLGLNALLISGILPWVSDLFLHLIRFSLFLFEGVRTGNGVERAEAGNSSLET